MNGMNFDFFWALPQPNSLIMAKKQPPIKTPKKPVVKKAIVPKAKKSTTGIIKINKVNAISPKAEIVSSASLNTRRIGAIKRAINSYISTKKGKSDFFIDHSNWYIGVTNNAQVRKVQHQRQKNISALYYKAWDAETKSNALAIEKHFHDLGMKDKASSGGAVETTKYVYVFKINPNMIDEVAYLLNIVE